MNYGEDEFLTAVSGKFGYSEEYNFLISKIIGE